MQRVVAASCIARRRTVELHNCWSKCGKSIGQQRFASNEGSSNGAGAASKDAKVFDLSEPSEPAQASSQSQSSSRPRSANNRRPRQQPQSLSGELRRQRRAALAEQGIDADTLLGPEEETSSNMNPRDIARPYSGRKEPRSGAPRQSRVDLHYVNETGYPQLKPEGGEQRRVQRPPQRQRHERSGIADDALSAMIERPSSTRSRSSAPASQVEPGRFDRSHNRPVRSNRPNDDYVCDAPGEGNNASRPALQRTQRQPFSPRTRNDASSTSTSGFGAPQRYGRVSGGNSGSGRPGKRPGQTGGRPQQRSRGPPGSVTRSGPSRKLDPAPKRVLGKDGEYSLASAIPASVEATSPHSVISAIHASQWQSNKTDIQNGHLSSVKPDTMAKIVKGDWQAYMAPVFQPQKHGAKEKVGGAGSLVNEKGIRQALLERARWAMLNNTSVGLKGKVEVVQKIEAAV